MCSRNLLIAWNRRQKKQGVLHTQTLDEKWNWLPGDVFKAPFQGRMHLRVITVCYGAEIMTIQKLLFAVNAPECHSAGRLHVHNLPAFLCRPLWIQWRANAFTGSLVPECSTESTLDWSWYVALVIGTRRGKVSRVALYLRLLQKPAHLVTERKTRLCIASTHGSVPFCKNRDWGLRGRSRDR